MASSIRQVGIGLKQYLMNQDKSYKISGIFGVKKGLKEFNQDDAFIKVILDLDIHSFLLHNLVSLPYPITMNVLECIECLCCYKIYFAYDHAVHTSEVILKSIYFEIKQHDHNDYLKNALQLLTSIFPKLNKYNTSKVLPFDRIIDIVKELLESKVDPEIICATTNLFGALLTYKPVQKYLNENILNKIEILWQMSVQKLSQSYQIEKKISMVALCLLGDTSIGFSRNILEFNNEKIFEFHKSVIDISVKCLEVICIPYIANVSIKSNHLCVEYLYFLESLLASKLPKVELARLCKQLVLEKNFNIIAQYIALNDFQTDNKNKQNIREFCLSLISQIITNLPRENNGRLPFTEVKYKKYILKGLQVIPNNVCDWLSLLGESAIGFHSKLSIISFSCIFYVHSNNLEELHSGHVNHFVTFLNDIPVSIQLSEVFLKDLWLLFSIVYSSFPEQAANVRGLRKANNVLQRLILTHSSSLDNVLTYHPSILNWTCLAVGIKRQIQLEVFAIWLKKAYDLSMCRTALISATRNCKTASYVLLYLAKKGAPEYALPATEILRISLQNGYLVQNDRFTNLLCMYVSDSINEISKENIVRERVVNAIYMLQLGSYISIIPDIDMIEYSINNFTNLLGAIGISELLPSVFYVKAFEYTNGILSLAKQNRIQQVFIAFMNSERILCVFMAALLSGNQDISIGASKIFINLLEYQNNSRLDCKKYLTIHNNSLIKLLSITHTEQLLLNLQILYKLLNIYTLNPILKIFYPMDNSFIKGLYLRCLNLSCKPGLQEIAQYSYKCLQAILNYSRTNHLAIHEYLLNHPGNHTLVIIYFDEETSRPVERSFLNFLLSWLFCAGKNKEKIFNKLSINFSLWRMSLIQITDQIIDGRSLSKSKNLDLIYNIANQIMVFSQILPESTINILRDNYMI